MKTFLMIILLSIVGYASAQSTTVYIDTDNGYLSATVTSTLTDVVKTTVANIKARQETIITFGNLIYTISYTNRAYSIECYVTSTGVADVLFESTRVDDVRNWMSTELTEIIPES